MKQAMKICMAGFVVLLVFLEGSDAVMALQKKGRSDIIMVPDVDKTMKNAVKNAKKTLDGFLKKLKNPAKGTRLYTVKLYFKDKNGSEFMWLLPIRKRPNAPGYEGILVNKPGSVTSVKKGSLVRFRKKDILDWGYMKNKLWHGHYTTCALFGHMPKAEATKLRQVYKCTE